MYKEVFEKAIDRTIKYGLFEGPLPKYIDEKFINQQSLSQIQQILTGARLKPNDFLAQCVRFNLKWFNSPGFYPGKVGPGFYPGVQYILFMIYSQ